MAPTGRLRVFRTQGGAGASAPRAPSQLSTRSPALVLGAALCLVLLLLYTEDSLLSLAARRVVSLARVSLAGRGSSHGGGGSAAAGDSGGSRGLVGVETSWSEEEENGGRGGGADEAAERAAAAAEAALAVEDAGSGADAVYLVGAAEDGELQPHEVVPPADARPRTAQCFGTLPRLPPASKRRITSAALRSACDCFLGLSHAPPAPAAAAPEDGARATGRDVGVAPRRLAAPEPADSGASPSEGDATVSFTVPLLWWASARISAYADWANGFRSGPGQPEFSWRHGFILERPVESYPRVFSNRSKLAWESGMLFSPTYFVSGRFTANMSARQACSVLLQPVRPARSAEAAGQVWAERTGILGLRYRPRRIGALLLPSPFWSEAVARAQESLSPASRRELDSWDPVLRDGEVTAWVTPGALEAGLKSISNDLAEGPATGARLHLYRPLSPYLVPRFYPDIFGEIGRDDLLNMPPNSTALRSWAFVQGVTHNVTMYLITYAGVFFRKVEAAVIRLNTRAREALPGGPAPSAAPTFGGGDGTNVLEGRFITGVSVKACKIMATPSASRPPTPTPISNYDWLDAMRVDEYLPILHRWHRNVYHLFGETVTRAMAVYPYAEHSRGYIAGETALVNAMRLFGLWRVRDVVIDREAPSLVSPRALHLVDPMLCQMTAANDLLQLREAIRTALRLPLPSLAYLRGPIVRDSARIHAKLVRTPAANLPTAATSAVARYECPHTMYRRPHVLLIRRRSSRGFNNWHSLFNALASSGAVLHIFDEAGLPSLMDAFSLFARADVVVGVHGAGLTNLIASSPGAAVFEVLPASFAGLHYAEYSAIIGAEYHRWEVPGEKDSDVTAPVPEMMAALCTYTRRRFGVTQDELDAAAEEADAAKAAADEEAAQAEDAARAAAPAAETGGSNTSIATA